VRGTNSVKRFNMNLQQLATAYLAHETQLNPLDRGLKANPYENQLLRLLQQQGHITAEEYEESYVEPQCVEYQIVHVNFGVTFTLKGKWLSVCPKTGSVQRM
jgi:hypothetical protein